MRSRIAEDLKAFLAPWGVAAAAIAGGAVMYGACAVLGRVMWALM